jgi:hypothetical protein
MVVTVVTTRLSSVALPVVTAVVADLGWCSLARLVHWSMQALLPAVRAEEEERAALQAAMVVMVEQPLSPIG